MNRFALIAYQRTGTNLLREVVNTNPALFLFAEVLNSSESPACWHRFVATPAAAPVPPETDADWVALMDRYWGSLAKIATDGRTTTSTRWTGFDVKYNQLRYLGPVLRDLDPDGHRPRSLLKRAIRQGGERLGLHALPKPFLLGYLWQHRIPVIHLVRRNVIHVAISEQMARARGLWHNYEGQSVDGRYRIDPGRVLSIARHAVRERQAFRHLARGLDVLQCVYETMVADLATADARGRLPRDTPTFGAIAGHLDVPDDFHNPGTLKKCLDRPYRQIIENYREVVRAIDKSEFSGLADTL